MLLEITETVENLNGGPVCVRICEGVTNTVKRAAPVRLGLVVKVWRVRATVDSDRPRETII